MILPRQCCTQSCRTCSRIRLAMGNPHEKWRFVAGKFIHKNGGFSRKAYSMRVNHRTNPDETPWNTICSSIKASCLIFMVFYDVLMMFYSGSFFGSRWNTIKTVSKHHQTNGVSWEPRRKWCVGTSPVTGRSFSSNGAGRLRTPRPRRSWRLCKDVEDCWGDDVAKWWTIIIECISNVRFCFIYDVSTVNVNAFGI